MKATDIEDVSPDARTGRVIDAYLHLSGRIEDIAGEISLLNEQLQQLPTQFITGSAKIPTGKDMKRLASNINDLWNNHDLYCAELIIMRDRVLHMIEAANHHRDTAFQ